MKHLEFSSPFYLQYNPNDSTDRQEKDMAWNAHFTLYGRGSTMYRTNELYELIFQGIPDHLRQDLWLLFSGAIHEVRRIRTVTIV